MKHLFKKLNITWLSVIIFAIIIGIYTGSVMMITSLKDTSFQDIGISYECWLIFAVIIVVICKKNYEAMLKCFVFFLISQPLIYLTQVVCGTLSLDLALYYYKSIWFLPTLLTLPGGFIAYYCKKQNLLGSIILGIGNTIQTVLGIHYLYQAIDRFPNHLLSSIISFASIIIMTLAIQKDKHNRIITFVVTFILTAAILLFVILDKRTMF